MGADVTVIIPAYNRLWSLPRAVESCRNTNCKTEIIVVDDGSTDGTGDWLSRQNDVIALSQSNWGKCWAVNRAFGQASGRFVKFLDSDDEITAGTIDRQFELASKQDCDIMVSGYRLIDENGTLLREQPWTVCDDFMAQQLGECDSSHYSAYLFKKDFINDIPHRPDFAFRDDRLFVLEAALKKPRIAVDNDLALQHTEHLRARLQRNSGMQQMVQNYQHLNIYKKILGSLAEAGELTSRRKDAACRALWPLCTWIARHDTAEAADLYRWIKELSPGFKIEGSGLRAKLYRFLGVNSTHRLIHLMRLNTR